MKLRTPVKRWILVHEYEGGELTSNTFEQALRPGMNISKRDDFLAGTWSCYERSSGEVLPLTWLLVTVYDTFRSYPEGANPIFATRLHVEEEHFIMAALAVGGRRAARSDTT